MTARQRTAVDPRLKHFAVEYLMILKRAVPQIESPPLRFDDLAFGGELSTPLSC